MKNLKYFPFERNRYFYGKLLTVDDFETEQKYMNDKRRLINRFLHGSGVVSGMRVVRVDDTSISVEMGLALDFSGREIIIDTPVLQKLSLIDGFAADGEPDAGYTYLCIEYAETEKEAVHSIASSGARPADQTEANKYAEGYHLFLTTQEPEFAGTAASFYEDTRTVYWGNGIRIRQTMPKFIHAAGQAELVISIENMGQQQPFGFSYDLDLTCLSSQGKDRISVVFNERDYQKAGQYTLRIPLQAMAVKEAEGKAELVQDRLQLTIGERQVQESVSLVQSCSILNHNVKEELMQRYYKTAMEEIVRHTYQQSIYLARIRLIRAGSAYVIEEIENMPFSQYIWSSSLAGAVNRITMGEIEALQAQTNHNHATPVLSAAPVSLPYEIATGSVILDLGIGGRAGEKFFSPEIAHGLGIGPVTIILGQAWTASDDSDRVYGDPHVFEDVDDILVTDVQLAARTDIRRGVFTIGAMTTATANSGKLRVDWTAIRDKRAAMQDMEQKKLLLKPDIMDLEVRESSYFEVVFQGVADQRVRFSVPDPQGGTIDENGLYTAPNTAGVYEVRAQSLAYPELTASTYVVVRESQTTDGRLL